MNFNSQIFQKQNNKTQLECIYLMNVALYLPLQDIPTFVQINSKTKDACDGLKINPIDTVDNFSNYNLKKQLSIVNKSFPRLQTLYLHASTFEYLLDNFNVFREYLPNVELFRSEKPVKFSKNYLHQFENDNYFIKMKNNFKRIHLFDSSVELSHQYSLDYVSISDGGNYYGISFEEKMNRFIQEIELCEYFHSKYISIPESFYFYNLNFWKTISQKLSDYCDYLIVNIELYNINQDNISNLMDIFPNNTIFHVDIGKGNKYFIPIEYKNEFFNKLTFFLQQHHSRPLMNEYFNELFYPHTFCINYQIDAKYELMNFTSEHMKIILGCDIRKISLPPNTKIIDCRNCKYCKIDNWEELTKVKRIENSNFNINTPMKYWLREYTEDKKSVKTKMTFRNYFLTFVFVFLHLFMNISYIISMITNGFFSFKEHSNALFPYYSIYIMITIFIELKEMISLQQNKKISDVFGDILNIILFSFQQLSFILPILIAKYLEKSYGTQYIVLGYANYSLYIFSTEMFHLKNRITSKYSRINEIFGLNEYKVALSIFELTFAFSFIDLIANFPAYTQLERIIRCVSFFMIPFGSLCILGFLLACSWNHK